MLGCQMEFKFVIVNLSNLNQTVETFKSLANKVNVSLQPTSFQNSDDVTIINTNNKHTYNRNNFEHEDWVWFLIHVCIKQIKCI